MDDIVHLEFLSKLKFEPEEKANFSRDFQNIINFVDEIKELNLADDLSKKETISISDLREDEAKASLPQAEALQNAPKQKDGCYVTPLVVD